MLAASVNLFLAAKNARDFYPPKFKKWRLEWTEKVVEVIGVIIDISVAYCVIKTTKVEVRQFCSYISGHAFSSAFSFLARPMIMYGYSISCHRLCIHHMN